MLIAIILIINLSVAQAFIKVWNPPDHQWKYSGSNRQCAEKHIVYPRYSAAALVFPNHFSPIEIVLPATGAMILQDQTSINFDVKSSCPLNSGEQILWTSAPESWYLSKNWHIQDKPENKAIPHIDRIPCECDTIVFPKNQTISVNLWATNDIIAQDIEINGKHGNFDKFYNTELGHLMFQNPSSVVKFIHASCDVSRVCGCHQSKEFNHFKDIVCFEDAAYCEVPHCLNPIQPNGFCCPICGASLQIISHGDLTCSSQLELLNNLFGILLTRINDGKFLKLVDYYVNIVPNPGSSKQILQLNIVDKGEYDGHSVALMNLLEENGQFSEMIKQHFKKNIAGIPYLPMHQSYIGYLIFGSLGMVMSFFGILYLHYIKEYWKKLPLNRLHFLPSPFTFARFVSSNEDTDGTAIVVGYTSPSTYDATETSFENPLNQQVDAASDVIETINANVFNDFDIDDYDTSSVSNLVEVELDSH